MAVAGPIPGEMETAVVARGILHHRKGLGHGSSEQAEWLALLDALQVAEALGAPVVEALGDSAAVINQARGVSKCQKPELRRCLEAFEQEARHFASLRVRHIKRTQNLADIALAKARDWRGIRDRSLQRIDPSRSRKVDPRVGSSRIQPTLATCAMWTKRHRRLHPEAVARLTRA